MKTASSPFPLPTEIHQRLVALRGLIARFIACQAIVLTAIWLISAFWIFGILDYLPARLGSAESPRVVRMIMLVIFGGGTLYLLQRFFLQRWLVRWGDSSLALLIEAHHPEFQSALVTTVQASQPTDFANSIDIDHPKRAGLLAIARDRALKLIESVDIQSLVRFRPLQTQLSALGLLLIVSLILGLAQPQWTILWSRRLFALSNDPWPRMAEIGVTGVELDVPTFTGRNTRQRYSLPFRDNIASVPKGQPCQLKSWASLKAKLVPEVCTVYYRDPAGNRGRANMRRVASDTERQSFVLDGPPLESLNDSLWLSIAGGDVRIQNLELHSVDAPLVNDLTLNVIYPEYLQQSTKTIWGKESIPYRTGMRLPEGTRITATARTNKPIDRCDYVVVRSGQTAAEDASVDHSFDLQVDHNEFELPIGTLDGNILIELRLWDIDGICSTRVQQFVISTINDLPPRVDLVLKGIGSAITENAVLPAVGKVHDDYDVRSVWMESVMEDTPMFKTPMTFDIDGNTSTQLDLKQLRDEDKFTVKVGSTISLNLAADDFLNLTDQPHIGRANPIQLNVVTPDQLLIVLERRELAMRARLEQIIGELSQMRDLMVNMSRIAKKPLAPKLADEKPIADNTSDEPDDDASAKSVEDENDPKRIARLQLLRSQQATTQLAKSEGELRGVEREIAQINQELINNRIDSADRRTRLEDKIRKPLALIMENNWPPMATDIIAIEKHLTRPDSVAIDLGGTLDAAILKNNQVISALSDILKDMIDIQDFNELIDMVRSILDDENKVIDKTKQEQKNQLLDLLK